MKIGDYVLSRGLAIARFVGGRLREAFASLPLILVLALLSQWLEQSHVYRAFDDGILAVIAALRPVTDVEKRQHKSLLTVIVSREMFETELGRRLPIDKHRLGSILSTVADEGPSLIAIDVDAVPHQQRAKGQALGDSPMYVAIESLLKRGISVVAVSYPRLTVPEREQARQWRNDFCNAAAALKSEGGRRPGKLFWASSWLQSEGRGHSVLRYFKPQQATEVAKADESLLPLGLVLSAAMGISGHHQEALLAEADYCASPGRNVVVEDSLKKKPPFPEAYINYFSNPPPVLELRSSESFRQSEHDLRCKAVVLGVSSFEGVDEHMTPMGQLPGAAVHATVAASVSEPLTENHVLAFLFDVLLGYLFMLLFLALQSGNRFIAERSPEAESLLHLSILLAPLLPLFGLVGGVLRWGSDLAGFGLWLNPLPLIIGLLLHLYAELTEHKAHREPQSPFETIKAWAGRFAATPRQWWHVRSRSGVERVDLFIGTLAQLSLLAILVGGSWSLLKYVIGSSH